MRIGRVAVVSAIVLGSAWSASPARAALIPITVSGTISGAPVLVAQVSLTCSPNISSVPISGDGPYSVTVEGFDDAPCDLRLTTSAPDGSTPLFIQRAVDIISGFGTADLAVPAPLQISVVNPDGSTPTGGTLALSADADVTMPDGAIAWVRTGLNAELAAGPKTVPFVRGVADYDIEMVNGYVLSGSGLGTDVPELVIRLPEVQTVQLSGRVPAPTTTDTPARIDVECGRDVQWTYARNDGTYVMSFPARVTSFCSMTLTARADGVPVTIERTVPLVGGVAIADFGLPAIVPIRVLNGDLTPVAGGSLYLESGNNLLMPDGVEAWVRNSGSLPLDGTVINAPLIPADPIGYNITTADGLQFTGEINTIGLTSLDLVLPPSPPSR